ncbi:MAG: hypothetical protein Q4G61_02765, partial [Tissierellia bacterium]|nr:hypothetical protein [Tissierellia bacterium]
KSIQKQYYSGALFLVLLGVIVATLLAGTGGRSFTGALIGRFGVADFRFVMDKVFVLGIAPIVISAVVWIGTVLGLRNIHRIDISAYIKE